MPDPSKPTLTKEELAKILDQANQAHASVLQQSSPPAPVPTPSTPPADGTQVAREKAKKFLSDLEAEAAQQVETISPTGLYGVQMNGKTILAWTKSTEFLFSGLFILLTMGVFLVILALRPKVLTSMGLLRLVLLPMVICCAMCLIVAGYSKDQINIVMPLLALVAGNLLARTSSPGGEDGGSDQASSGGTKKGSAATTAGKKGTGDTAEAATGT